MNERLAETRQPTDKAEMLRRRWRRPHPVECRARSEACSRRDEDTECDEGAGRLAKAASVKSLQAKIKEAGAKIKEAV